MKEDEKRVISQVHTEGVSITPKAEPLLFDDGKIALCLRAVRLQRAFMNWKDHGYYDVPSYSIVLQKVLEALYELNYLMRPVEKAVPESQSIISGIEVLIDETIYALDQYDHGNVTEESIDEAKEDCDRLITLIFGEFLGIKLSDLNSSWVSIVNSRLDEDQLRKRDELFLRKASEKGVSIFNECVGPVAKSV